MMNSSLLSLEIQGNDLTGPIPSEVGQMTTLNHWFAQDNNLTGALPVPVQELVFGENSSFVLLNLTGNDNLLLEDAATNNNNSSTSLLRHNMCWINATYTEDCSQRKFLFSQTCRCDCSC